MSHDAEALAGGAAPGAGWSDEVDEILEGDHVVVLAYSTPAKGAVLLPLSNFGLRDRDAGTISVNSSVGVWKKLERIRSNPRVALAFHTREHALTSRPEYVLVQGTAELLPPVADYPSTIVDRWERFEPWRDLHPLWKRWQRVYALRVEIRVHAERILVWGDLDASGPPRVLGPPLPADPPPQSTPAKGAGSRIDHRRAARRAGTLPNVLLGWIGADAFPVVVPAAIAAAQTEGFALRIGGGLTPSGGRRAGLTAHSFSRQVIGQHQRKYTGWLNVRPDGAATYAPHTDATYRFPRSRILYRLVSGYFTRRGHRQAREAGVELR
jgi:nitroimidazol reductase NimA-like FMN-containing flavoprotein (pyridoxamine 5'-phosphate oxidase superfamily)